MKIKEKKIRDEEYEKKKVSDCVLEDITSEKEGI